jgi:hypothetical protein
MCEIAEEWLNYRKKTGNIGKNFLHILREVYRVKQECLTISGLCWPDVVKDSESLVQNSRRICI